MNLTRTIGRLLFAASVLLLALPTLVAAQTKQFSLAASPADVGTGPVPAPGMSVRIKNETPNGNSTINSVTVTVPQGFALTAAPTKTYPGNLTWNANSFTITDMSPLKPGKFFFVSLPGVTATGATCGAAAWSGVAWTGSGLNGNTFAPHTASGLPAGYAETTNVTGTLSLAFIPGSLPTSVVQGGQFTVGVQQVSSCGGTLPPILVTLSGAPAGSFAGSQLLTSGGVVTLTGTFNAIGDVTVTASAPGYASATTSLFEVYANGNLKCPDIAATPAETQFSASASGVTNISQTGYAAGYRGLNVLKLNGVDCAPVNYEFVNNVLGDGPGTNGEKTDPKGQVVPANGVSFVWDQVYQPNAAYSYTVTWQPEWFGLASLNNRKTKFCTGAAPNVCSSAVEAQACLSPVLDISSLPGSAPACVSGEVWTVLDPSECASLGSAPLDQPSCVRFSTTVTDIFDPVFIR